jgi:N-acetylglucosaminyldiphosphoundecaprenol N-acetyl-beta-D-mannosaminyltransferase
MSARAEILGCAIDRLDMPGSLAAVERAIESRSYTQHMAINAAKLVTMQDDPELRRIIAGCGLVNADGQGVVWASRLLGDPLPERVAGIDLMYALLARAERRGYRVYFLGARAEVLGRALERLREAYPALQVAGARDGYFSDEEEAAVCAEIAASRADILLVAMSSPRKEYFLGTHGPRLGAPFVMGVGGSIDVAAGITRRAPLIWQRLGCEWLFRLLQEPRRMFRRYAVTNARFAFLVARALLTDHGAGRLEAQRKPS